MRLRKIKRRGSKLERSWSPPHLILMCVLGLSCFRRSRLLWWRDWMTEITCVEKPMRHLIDNAWQKCFCLLTDLGLSKVSVSCVVVVAFCFFFGNLILRSEMDWWDGHRLGSLDSELTVASGSHRTPRDPQVIHIIFILLRLRGPTGDMTRKHNLTPLPHSFSGIRLDWNFPAHFPGAVKWAVSHVSEPAPTHLL